MASTNDGWVDADQISPQDSDWQDAPPEMVGEKLPSYANGATSQTAINESPISYEDRLKLSVGDMSGKVKFLKDNYGEVQRTKSGDLTVKYNNVWHRVDPDTFDMSDPWKMTKEIVGDMADLAPTLVKTGAQVGAAVLTGGASLPAQLAASGAIGSAGKGVESVLGRLVGTYQGSDEDILKDVALEGLINVGAGAAFALGVKPSISFVADKLKIAGKALAELPEQSKEIITSMYGTVLGKGGVRSVNKLMEKTTEVVNAIKELAASPGGPELAFKQRAIHLIEDSLDNIPKATSNFFGAGKREIIATLEDGFTSKQPEVVKNLMAFFEEKALVEGGKLKTREIAITDMAKKGINSEWAGNPGSWKIVQNLYKGLQDFKHTPSVSGKQGAENLFAMRSSLMSMVDDNLEIAQKLGFSKAQPFLGEFGERIQDAIIPSFNVANKIIGAPPTNKLIDLNKAYKKLMFDLMPLTNAKQATRNQGAQAYEYVIDNITSQAGRKSTVKTALDTAMDVLEKHGSKEGQKASGNYARLMIYDAAKDFSGWVKPGLIGTTATLGVPGALLAGSPGGALAMASTALLSSPRLGAGMIQGGKAVGKKATAAKDMVKSFMASNAMIRGLTPAARSIFIKTPQALANMAQTVYSAPGVREGTGRQLMSEAFKSFTGGNK